MTPKEKALDLIHKFEHAKKYSNVTNAMSKELAKECALIAVDEIVQSRKDDNIFRVQDLTYWQQVKQEIEKL